MRSRLGSRHLKECLFQRGQVRRGAVRQRLGIYLSQLRGGRRSDVLFPHDEDEAGQRLHLRFRQVEFIAVEKQHVGRREGSGGAGRRGLNLGRVAGDFYGAQQILNVDAGDHDVDVWSAFARDKLGTARRRDDPLDHPPAAAVLFRGGHGCEGQSTRSQERARDPRRPSHCRFPAWVWSASGTPRYYPANWRQARDANTRPGYGCRMTVPARPSANIVCANPTASVRRSVVRR